VLNSFASFINLIPEEIESLRRNRWAREIPPFSSIFEIGGKLIYNEEGYVESGRLGRFISLSN
jgi:hypothetical protein